MKVHTNATQAAAQKQSLIQRIFRVCIRFLGALLFILFMTHNLLVSMGVDTFVEKPLPLIAILSCFVCVTVGANYWFGDQVIRWR
ncbi:MAG: hypothetical protein ABFC73_13210, partial [Clostridiaceae bacterium]